MISLDRKLKTAALTISVRHLLHNKKSSPEKTVKSILEICTDFYHPSFTQEEQREFHDELIRRFSMDISMDASMETSVDSDEMIARWILERFNAR